LSFTVPRKTLLCLLNCSCRLSMAGEQAFTAAGRGSRHRAPVASQPRRRFIFGPLAENATVTYSPGRRNARGGLEAPVATESFNLRPRNDPVRAQRPPPC